MTDYSALLTLRYDMRAPSSQSLELGASKVLPELQQRLGATSRS